MAPLHVLLAEDNLVNQKLALALLSRRNAKVTLALNGMEAVEAWAASDFDVVLMDLQMPELDGLEATRIIRSRERAGEHTPIVAVTARAMVGDREECYAAGMDAYLSKPIRPQELLDTIDRLTSATPASSTIEHSTAGSTVFDLPMFRANLGNDDALVAELIALFMTEAPMYLERVCAAVAFGDAPAVANAAHTLKGAATAITASAVGAAADALEQHARGGSIAGAATRITALQCELATLGACLRTHGLIALATTED